ncbi:hypothetical protein MN116_000318 [Schistosoma mekongi]|uniref:DUF4806 domain-containing protein n=1 Tax=Schistosoma mekongi TaxID=38744 RepID=A0AAE1Z482_SCHME|nr:hypothetical protein MN116_000318 [Schistosoma mekongi]
MTNYKCNNSHRYFTKHPICFQIPFNMHVLLHYAMTHGLPNTKKMANWIFVVAFLKSISDYVVARTAWITGEYLLYKHSLTEEQVIQNTKPGVGWVLEEFTIAGAADTFDEAKVILNRVRLAYQKSMACSSQSSTSTIPMPRPPRRRKMLSHDEVDNDYPSSIIDNSQFIFSQPDYSDVVRQLRSQESTHKCSTPIKSYTSKESAGQSSKTQIGDLKDIENVLRSLSSNMELVIENQKKIIQLLEKLTNNSNVLKNSSLINDLPIRSNEKFRQIETRLGDDDSAKEMYSLVYSVIVGDIRMSVKKALQLVFDDIFMQRLSWTSTNQKIGIRNSRCELTIKRAILHYRRSKNLPTENFDVSYRHAMRRWFYNIRDRLGGRACRRRAFTRSASKITKVCINKEESANLEVTITDVDMEMSELYDL